MHYDKELIAHKLIRWENYLNEYKLPAWTDIPDIGLYMDQVVVLLSQYLDFISVEEQKNKPVTPTTINNYVRLRVMPAPNRRKYYRLHMAYLIMIFTLKQSVSIPCIQKIVSPNLTVQEMEAVYSNYVEKLHAVAQFFTQQTRLAAEDILSPGQTDDTAVDRLVTQNVLMAGFSRLLAEKLLDLKDANTEEVLRVEAEKDARQCTN